MTSTPTIERTHRSAVVGSPPVPGGGIVATTQLARAGFDPGQITSLVRRGDLVAVHDGVYRTEGTHMSPRRQLLAACLAIGGVVGASHRAALWLWDLSNGTPPIEVTSVPTDRMIPDGVLVYERPDFGPAHLTVHRGVPVTTPARTLADVGTAVERGVLATAVDKALYLRLTTLGELAHACAEANRHRSQGGAVLRSVLTRRRP